jgi:hypothetical protein
VYSRLEISESRRSEMARDSWRIFVDHPLWGTGLGTLQEVFPKYETLYDGRVVNHTHNDYVEVLAETGAMGGDSGGRISDNFFSRGLEAYSPSKKCNRLGNSRGGIWSMLRAAGSQSCRL